MAGTALEERVLVSEEALRDALTRAVKMHLDNAGIGIPFPQRDVHVIQMPGS